MISSSIVISAQTPSILTVDDPNLQEGTLLSTGEKQEARCLMDFESLEVFVEVSAEKPQEIISLHLTEDCKLVVDEVQREFATTNELLDHRMTFPTDLFGDQRQPSSTGSSWLRTSSTPTYNVTGKSEWNDGIHLDLAYATIEFTYRQNASNITMVGGATAECGKNFPWWRVDDCDFGTNSTSSSKIVRSTEGAFEIVGPLPVTYVLPVPVIPIIVVDIVQQSEAEHEQLVTYTAKHNSNDRVRCWSSNTLPSNWWPYNTYFDCQGEAELD